MKYNLDHRIFKLISSSSSGEVDVNVRFHYRQKDDVIWGTYEGGPVKKGTITGRYIDEDTIDFHYQHLNTENIVMTGKCISRVELLTDSRLRLIEKWQWTNGDLSSGESIVEEIKQE